MKCYIAARPASNQRELLDIVENMLTLFVKDIDASISQEAVAEFMAYLHETLTDMKDVVKVAQQAGTLWTVPAELGAKPHARTLYNVIQTILRLDLDGAIMEVTAQ